jgi:hypothetical protein
MTAVERAIMAIQNRIVCTPEQVEELRGILKEMTKNVFKSGWHHRHARSTIYGPVDYSDSDRRKIEKDWRDYERRD